MSQPFVALQPDSLFERVAIDPGMQVADLGCGSSGVLTFAMARRVGDDGLVYAVDVIPEVLEHISGRIRSGGHDNIQVIWSDIEAVGKTAIPANSLDRCFIQNVLSALKAEDQALEEAFRLLRPGGMLVVVDWLKTLGPGTAIPSRIVTPEHIERHAERLGFVPQERFTLGGYHYGYTLTKNR